MKPQHLLSASLGIVLCSLSFAGEQKPLAVTADGQSVLACHTKTTDGSSSSEKLVIRTSAQVNEAAKILSRGDDGKVLIITGNRTSNSLGVTTARCDYEGTTTLADAPGENWTQEAPAGTLFTARGNFQGFFLIASTGNPAVVSGLVVSAFSKSESTPLECTTDEAVAQAWVKSVFSYLPY